MCTINAEYELGIKIITRRPSLGLRDAKYGKAAQAPMSATKAAARAALFFGGLGGMPA